MLFNKKSIIVLLAASQLMTPLFAGQSKSVNELYNQLLKNQKTINPMTANPQVTQSAADALSKRDLYDLFKWASNTGLTKEYSKILSEPSNVFSVSKFFNPDHLRVIAYMQNKYGQGQPFQYSGDKQDTENVIAGSYNSPKGTITITRYGLLKGLLDTLEAMKYDAKNIRNPYFLKTEKMITDNLKKAIKASSSSNDDTYAASIRMDDTLETIKKLSGAGRRNADIKIMRAIESDLNKIIQKYSKK